VRSRDILVKFSIATEMPAPKNITGHEKQHQGHLYSLIKDMPLTSERLLESRRCIFDKKRVCFMQ
jgi:hypothetical protein